MKRRVEEASRKRLHELAELVPEKVDPAFFGETVEHALAFLEHIGSSVPRSPDADWQDLMRWQDALIEAEIPVGASVLDLGCGKGELLARLIDKKKVQGQGMELDHDAVLECVERGVPVFHADLDAGLDGFPDGHFDYVILEETLQALHRPIDVLREMLRVGRRGIVSFPNFAYWRVRLELAVRGRMPVTERLPFRWYDTPNIHLFSLQDFLDWAHENQVRVLGGHVLAEGQVRPVRDDDNLYAEEALFVIEKRESDT